MQNQLQTNQNQTRQIGNYILSKTIGAGTFGKVKLAIHIPTNQQVAMKTIMKSKITEVADFERVAREMHILRIVRHPSIIQLYQIIETKEHLFLVTQLAEKGELFDHLLRRGQIDEKQACKYFKQLISGVQYLHELKIAHRDLKLQNILLDYQNNLKIIDFGLSNTYQQNETLKTACGSPCYASPQMITGRRYDGLASDIWSCGIILFAMVCGYLPFQDQNTNELYKKIKSGNFYLPANLSNSFKSFITGIIQVDPSKRFKLHDIYNHAWYKISEYIPKKGIKVGAQLISTDPVVLTTLKKMGFDSNHMKISIEANKQGKDYAAYYLQLKKMRKQGHQSFYDINSLNYQPIVKIQNKEQSFQNTRKEYYFGEREYSAAKKKKSKSHKKTQNSSAYLRPMVKSKQRLKKHLSYETVHIQNSKSKVHRNNVSHRLKTEFRDTKTLNKIEDLKSGKKKEKEALSKSKSKGRSGKEETKYFSNSKKDSKQFKNKSEYVVKKFAWS